MTIEVSVSLEVKQDGKVLRSRHIAVTAIRARSMLSEAVHAVMDLAAAAGSAEGLVNDLTACQLERDRLKHRCAALAFLQYGSPPQEKP